MAAGDITTQDDLDRAIFAYYRAWDEDARTQTRSVGGQIEFVRVQSLVRRELAPGSRVLDVGGATGVHSRWLAAEGHAVTLIDPVPEQVAKAAESGTFEAVVGDARALPAPDESVDAVLLFGPLYHLWAREDRLRALREARRVLRPGGVLCAQGISRLAAVADIANGRGYETLTPADLHILRTGEWASSLGGFPGGHFHNAAELRDEVETAGFGEVQLRAVEGPNLGALEVAVGDDELVRLGVALAERFDQALATRPLAQDPLSNCGAHVMAIGRR